MIDRYCTPGMTEIWSREAKYRTWLKVELAIVEAHAELGRVPKQTAEAARNRADFSLARCDEFEKETRHDLMAFVRNVAETIGEEGRFIHLGVTSYDVIDTALGIMMRDSCDLIVRDARSLLTVIGELAKQHIDVPEIGRTHGIHAEPITFGFKCAGWYAELQRNVLRVEAAGKQIAVGKVSGAVGVHAITSPRLEEAVCKSLGLAPDPASTQIINRDRHADVLNCLALFGACLERIATELRNLQRTEILEVQEAFQAGQTGSSAMPHKRNPWNSETVCGLSRLLRGNATAMMESVATWHERDLSNSSLERVVFPDSFQVAHFMLLRMTAILSGLRVFPEQMKKNLALMGDLVFSEHLMIALIDAGMSREGAYAVAQRNAAKAWDGQDFKTCVEADADVVSHLTPETLREVFCLDHHLRNTAHTLSAVGLGGENLKSAPQKTYDGDS